MGNFKFNIWSAKILRRVMSVSLLSVLKSERTGKFLPDCIICFMAFGTLFAGCGQPAEKMVMCVQLDPLEKVFTEELTFVETSDTAAVAKGETATFQFVIKSIYPVSDLKIEAGNLVNGERQIAATEKAFVGYIRAGGSYTGYWGGLHSKYAVFPVSDLYPDILQEVETMDVAALSNQPLWIGYTIPRDAADGDYTATLTFTGKVDGKRFKITKEVKAKVYPVILPEQTLWVTNWFTSDGFSKMNGGQPVEIFSDRYWELLTAMAHVMRDHGQNTYLLTSNWSWNDVCNPEWTGTQYSFDFTNFDKMVELLIREGGLKRIEGCYLSGLAPGENAYFQVAVPKAEALPFSDEWTRAEYYLSQFLPALYSHLEEKGWAKMYMQHIGDEPNDATAPSYIKIAECVKKYMPDVPIIDALHSRKLANTVNVWVPMLDFYHKDYAFYQERQGAGDEVWYYTCCNPQGNYANRFLEQPLIQTRFLHWINYRYGATGYLHWGFNHWHYEKTNDAYFYGAPEWPAGDGWIVYPADGKVYSSIRLKAMRDGIADYELLKLLEQKSPDIAKELVGKVIRGFDMYDNNVRAFRMKRVELLEALSN